MSTDDAAEAQIDEVAEILVVIAGDIDDLRALARLAQDLLDHVVVELVPVPGLAQRPVVDEIADEIEPVRFRDTQEIEKMLRPARVASPDGCRR